MSRKWCVSSDSGPGQEPITFGELRRFVEQVASDAGTVGLGNADDAAVFAAVDARNAAVIHLDVEKT